MKLVAVLSDLSCPPRDGLHQQSLELLSALRRQGAEIALFTFARHPGSVDAGLLARDYGLRLAAPPVRWRGPLLLGGLALRLWPAFLLPGEVARIRAAMSEADSVYLEMALAAGLLTADLAPRTAINLVDPLSRRWRRMASVARRPAERLLCSTRSALAALFERSVNHPAVLWNAVSPSDAEYLRTRHGHARLTSIPVLLPPLPTPPSPPSSSGVTRAVVFADLREQHMRDAFAWFVENVLRPAGLRPDRLHVDVLGRTSATPQVQSMLEGLAVTVVPWVDDYRAYLAQAQIVILPDRVGTGLKNRAVQSLALGCAVLGTEIAFEGMDVRNGVHAVRSDDPALLVAGLRRLVDEPHWREGLGAAGRAFATTHYDAEVVGRQWLVTLQQLAAPR